MPAGIYRDQVAWWPKLNSRLYDVRMEISDTAGNAVHVDSRVTVPLVAWRNKTNSTAHAGNWAAQSVPPRQPKNNPQSNEVQNHSAARRQPPTKRQFVNGKQKMVCAGGVCKPVSDVSSLMAHRETGVSPVGSQIEYVDPPVPEGEIATNGATAASQQNVLAQTTYPALRPKSIPWAGTTENPIGEQNLAVGSTLDPVPATTGSNWQSENANGIGSEFEIRSLPPLPRRNIVTNSTIRELPGGMFVAESTASRSQRPPAEFRANTEPEWKGRGDVDSNNAQSTEFAPRPM